MTYRRLKSDDTWHWCRNCSNWPALEKSDIRPTRPSSGEFCDECLAKDTSGECYKA